MIRRMTWAPAQILGIDAGTLSRGAPGDVVVFDPSMEWTFTRADVRSKSANTPFLGTKLTGRALLTLKDGRVVHERPELQPRWGTRVKVEAAPALEGARG